jgi:hypothetical protein
MSEGRKPIEAKVAEILSTRSLVLNAGKEQGVQDGMVFVILNRKGEHILDPDTGLELGSLRLPKIRVQVAFVYDRMSVAKTFRTISTGGFGFQIPDIFLPTMRVTRPETLRSSEHLSADADLDESESLVKVGDPAIEVMEDAEKPKQGQKSAQA